jgi:membrane-associated phospholipid phosphatase
MLPVDPVVADRGLGEVAAVRTLPDAVVDLFGLLTVLGDPVTLLLLVATGYLLTAAFDRSPARMATAVALALGAFGLTLALKHAFALPRPPGAAADGYGFPSGHAIGATVVYGGLAALYGDDRVPWPRAFRPSVVAAALIFVVAASRVVIGVHYLVDVVAGVAVGAAYLAVALGWRSGRVGAADAGRAFALATGVALAALWMAVVRDTVVVAAAGFGGWIGWRVLAPRLGTHATGRGAVVAAVTLPVVVVTVGVVLDGGVSLPVAGGVTLVVGAALLAAPGLSTAVIEE